MSGKRVIIVTGGAQGIGRAIVEGLLADGAEVVIADLAGAEQAAAEL
ncbi:MAG: SDR family NAD(P)-dependent oxidoreductase, partial [Actinobacteria bacterium]|nr:SDR family NAD(P)-dependent oxidoreductase [Actinomycetota bacterium]